MNKSLNGPLNGKTVALLVANGFEEIEFTEAQRALVQRGAKLLTVSPEPGLVNGWHEKSWGHYFPIDRQLQEVLAADIDMLILPGGERSVAKLMNNPHVKRIVTAFLDGGKPIAAIGQGLQLLTLGNLRGQDVAVDAAWAEAIVAAAGTVSEEEVVSGERLVTARTSEQTAAWVEALLGLFAGKDGDVAAAA